MVAARIGIGVLAVVVLAWLAVGLRNARLEADEAGLANFDGRPREALRLLRDVVRSEPENFDAWFLMASVAARIDPPLAARAEERARALNPLQFRPRG